MTYKYDSTLTGNLIRKERKAISKSRNKFCDMAQEIHGIEIAPESLKNWENGDVNEIATSNLLKLCSIFNCEIDYLLGNQEYKTKAAADICKETGLSKESANLLISCHKNHDSIYGYGLTMITDFFLKPYQENTLSPLHDSISEYENSVRSDAWLRKNFCDIYPLIRESANEAAFYTPDAKSIYENSIRSGLDKMNDDKLIEILDKYAAFDTSSSEIPLEDLKGEFINFIVKETFEDATFMLEKEKWEYFAIKEFSKLISEYAQSCAKEHCSERDKPTLWEIPQRRNGIHPPSFYMEKQTRKED